jgi:hypothetical protein
MLDGVPKESQGAYQKILKHEGFKISNMLKAVNCGTTTIDVDDFRTSWREYLLLA